MMRTCKATVITREVKLLTREGNKNGFIICSL